MTIQAIAFQAGLLNHKAEIEAVSSTLFSNRAVRPTFSALDSSLLRDKLSLPPVPWQQQLAQALSLFSPAQIKKDE